MSRKPSNFRLEQMSPEAQNRIYRLRQAINEAGGNKVIAAKTGINPSRLTAYVTGEEMKLGRAIEIAEACGVNLLWLATGLQQEQLPAALPDNRLRNTYIYVPYLDVKASAGPGTEVVDEVVTEILALDEQFVRQQLRRRPEDLRVIIATGDSMDPTIRDGDLLLVDTSVQEVSGSRIYVLEIGGALLVKRIQLLLDGALSVRSDNPKYERETVRPTERQPIRIIGEVVYQAGPVRS